MAPDDAPMHAPGDVVDGFRLVEPLHVGRRNQVWAVERVERVDGDIALVMKLPCNINLPASLVGFEMEQMVLPRLAGPHVPRLVAQGDGAGHPYLVTERIDGSPLAARIGASSWPIGEIAEIGRRLATALHDLHRQHVVHLDVTPAHVMFRASGEAVLIGFGLAHHDQLPDLLDEAQDQSWGDSPCVSPEQVQFIRNDARSDLFALGVLLYRLTTAEPPFGSPTSLRGMRERLYRDPMPPRALRADCPPWLQEVILRCLEIDPDRRHQSAAQLAFDLHAPERIPLSARAGRMTRRGTWPTMRRWFSTVAQEPQLLPSASEQAERHPILMVALDVTQGSASVLEAQAGMVRRLLQTAGDVRLACVAVLEIRSLGLDDVIDDAVNNPQTTVLARLKHWARDLSKPQTAGRELRVTLHVLEAVDAAAAIVDFASRHQVDQIVIGARRHDTSLSIGAICSRIVAEAPCSVTVVRHTLREER